MKHSDSILINDIPAEKVPRMIAEQYGEAALLDTKKLTGLISDYVNKDIQMKNLLTLAARENVPKKLHELKNIGGQHREYKIKEIAARFIQDNSLTKEAAYKAINCYMYALGYEVMIKSKDEVNDNEAAGKSVKAKKCTADTQPKTEKQKSTSQQIQPNDPIHGQQSPNAPKVKTLTREDAKKLNNVYINIPDEYTEIDKQAFERFGKTTVIDMPDSVTVIGEGAFRSCSSLTGVTISKNVKIISEYAFYNCTELKEVCVPDGVTEIKKNAFASCRNLRSIVIPDSVKIIENKALTANYKLIVTCSENSYAHRYCMASGIKLNLTDAESPKIKTNSGAFRSFIGFMLAILSFVFAAYAMDDIEMATPSFVCGIGSVWGGIHSLKKNRNFIGVISILLGAIGILAGLITWGVL